MSRYTSGWTWSDGAHADSDDPANSTACSQLYAEIGHLYHQIPDPADEQHQRRIDCGYEAVCEEHGPAAAEQWLRDRGGDARRLWDEIAALESTLASRGARLREPYEHLNEDADRVEQQESS